MSIACVTLVLTKCADHSFHEDICLWFGIEGACGHAPPRKRDIQKNVSHKIQYIQHHRTNSPPATGRSTGTVLARNLGNNTTDWLKNVTEPWNCINKTQVYRCLQSSVTSPPLAGSCCKAFPTIPMKWHWGQLRWIYICNFKSCIFVARQKMVPQKKGTLIYPCSYAIYAIYASSCDCSLTSWTLARAERRMSDASQSKHASCASMVLCPSTSPGPEGQNFDSQSSPIPQPKCSNQIIYTCFFLGNFKEVFEAHQSMHPKIPEATKHQRRDHPNSGPKYKLERPPATSHPSPSIHPMSGKIERIKHQRTKNQEKVSCIYIYIHQKTYIYIIYLYTNRYV